MQNKYISEEAYYNNKNKNPVYVVLMNGGTPLSKIISGFTGDTYTHACISFNAKLKPLYSFGLTNDNTFGFAIANPKDKKAFPHIDKYAVYVMYVTDHQLYKMKKRLKWFINNRDNLKFDFPALVSVFFKKDTENHSDKYFCSRFVAEILKIGEVNLEDKASLYRPESLLVLSNISLVNWGRDILYYNWIKTRNNERLIKANKYANPKNLIPKFESIMNYDFDIDQCYIESKSNKQIYFISDKNMDSKVLSPRIPNNMFTRNGYEDNKTKRVCFAPSIDKSLMSLSNNITGKEFYVHIAIGDYKVYKPTVKQVPDSKVTGELWVTKPVKVSCIGKIKVIGDMGLPGHKFSYRDMEAELYDWKWEWVDKLNDIPESYMEGDSKYDFYTRVYGKEYTKKLHGVEILKTRLKQGKITQEEFDKEYEKIKPASSFKIKPEETKESLTYDDRESLMLFFEDGYDTRVRKAMRHKNNKRLFVVSKQKIGDTLKPKSYKVNGRQENFCIFAHSIDHALIMLDEFCLGREYFVYQTEDIYDLYNPKDDERIYPKCASEVWIKSPVKISYMKKIKVTRDMFYHRYKNSPPEDIGNINNLYAWNTIETGTEHDSTWIKESYYKLEETMLYEFANKELLDKSMLLVMKN